MIATVAVAVLTVTSGLLLIFGVNLLYLTVRAMRMNRQQGGSVAAGAEPLVCVQIPIYNERYVAERVLDAVCVIDWPRHQFEVQVLDDSDDDTTTILARRTTHWRRLGVQIQHVRRGSRQGFKAGALAHGLELTAAPFIAIFDADFVPAGNFLRETVGSFEDPEVGFVQARWGHLDEGYSWFTRLQAMAIDFHFLIEQAVRSRSGYFTNFTGTAGVWRRKAIVDSGGWSSRTLTEDLDLSYRAQLRGWKAAYIDELVVPEELPVSIDAYRRQQSRWATGSFQSAFLLLRPVMRSDAKPWVKFQAAMHLLAYGVGPVMLIQLSSYPLLLAFGAPQFTAAAAISILVGTTPWLGFMAAQTLRGRRWWSGIPALLCQVVGAGMSLNTLIALVRSTGAGGTFERTPKHRIEGSGQEWRDQDYVRVGDPRVLVETAAAFLALALVPFAVTRHQYLIGIYGAMFALGFLTVVALSLKDFLEVMAFRRLGSRAVRLMRGAAPAGILIGVAALLLLLAAQVPEPFEDGYGHWLIAASLAQTGSLHDPLFGMEDTWLPGYHFLAAAVLQLFGLWQLGLLKALSAVLGLLTAACVYALAPNVRQARLAVAALVLNPVFLFTSGQAVVEPLLTALLMAGALAAVRGRMKLAALLAAMACLTSTKAWIWVAAVVAVGFIEIIRVRSPRPARSVAFAVPALAVLVFLQLGFAPASHSLARGSLELVSATGRGTLPASGIARLAEVAGTYGLAALPLIAFAVPGAILALRRHSASVWSFVYLPALAYLSVVVWLIASGYYTGSHRYLYPALPALALLGAAALDRYVAGIRLLALGATAALSVAFLPVFMSFANDNAGLIAAGRAATAGSGTLLTDSPVVAYYSEKPISQIMGSRFLPADPARAVAWMRSEHVSTLVVEDISYYRATAVFPDLAEGKTSPPFSRLGDENRYQVPGGKTVYAYELDAGRTLQPLFGSVDVALSPSPRQGKTSPLAKGIALWNEDGTLAGEGMGFGVPIVHYADGWVYPRTSTDADLSMGVDAVWERTFELDEIGGDAAHGYRFAPITSRGEVVVTYTIDSSGVSISVRPVWLAAGYSEVGILNEQSAAFNDFAAERQPTLVDDAFGSWIPVTGSWARLRSGSLGVEWSLPPLPGASLHGGRELAPPDFDWAGLDYVFSGPFTGTAYHINVKGAR